MLVGSGAFDGMTPLVRHVHVNGYGGKGYDSVVDWGGLGRLAGYLTQLQIPKRVFLITDSNLHRLYAPALLQHLSRAGFEPHLYVMPAGEASKSRKQLDALYDWLIEQHAERRETIVALGGGVIGDLAGYAAATYLRGVPLVQIPTSLLAQVDAAIGGKTGINHPKGKNLIGAFYHPRLVLVDPATLLTLPRREYIEGWAETVKYGIILDTELFALLETHVDALQAATSSSAELLCSIIARCIDLKVKVIEEDEREQGLRAILNYGHTVAHALENVTGYASWLHGEAVSLGMVVAATLAQRAELCISEDVARQNRLLEKFGLPIRYDGPVRAQELLTVIQVDKKVADKRVRWILPRRIGEVTVTTLPDALIEQVLADFFTQES
jgi:3-dehydroquinate synthase